MSKSVDKNLGIAWMERLLFVVFLFLVAKLTYFTFIGTMDNMHADLANEIAYKVRVAQTATLWPTGFYHVLELLSSRLPFLFAPFYWITGNILLSHQISVVFSMLLQLAVLCYLLKQLEFKRITMLLTMILFLGCNYIADLTIVYGDMYAGFVIAILLSLGLLLNLKKNWENTKTNFFYSPHNIIKLTVLAVIAAWIGFGSPKLALMLYVPYIIVEGMRYLINHCQQHRITADSELISFFISVGLLIINGIFYLAFLLSDILYTPFSLSSGSLSTQLSWDNISMRLRELLMALGLVPAEKMISLRGIYYALTILGVIGVIICTVLILKYKFSSECKQIAWLGVITTGVMSLYLIIMATSLLNARYFTATILLAFIIVGIVFDKTIDQCRWVSVFITGFVIILATIPSLSGFTWRSEIPLFTQEKRQNLSDSAQYILEQDYDLATAAYWNAGLLRAYSNWTLDVQQCHTFDRVVPFKWLVDGRVYTSEYNKRKQVLVLDEQDKVLCESNSMLDSATFLKQFGEIYLYEIPNSLFVNQIADVALGETVVYDFNEWKERSMESQTNVSKGSLIAGPQFGGFFGPYCEVESGSFGFELSYSVLQAKGNVCGSFDIAVNGEVIAKAELDSQKQKVVLNNIVFDQSKNIEVRAFCNEGNVIEFSSIAIKREQN